MQKIIILALFLSSCTGNIYQTLNTEKIEPVISRPAVSSFSQSKTIEVKWGYDRGADSYLLYRSSLPSGSFELIYQGDNLEFSDYVDNETFYYYRLAKKRGNKEFEMSGYTPGITGIYIDGNEGRQAVPVAGEIRAAIHYYIDNYSNEIIDSDLYSVTLAPRKSMTVIVGTFENLSNNDLLFNTTPIVQGASFWIENTTAAGKTLYFTISVNKAQCINKAGYYNVVEGVIIDN